MHTDKILDRYIHSEIPDGAQLEFVNSRNLKQYTHRLYNRYPARSISLVPQAILLALASQRGAPPARVLDPFMGSGTTALEATLLGMDPYGVEIDPFARFIADMKVRFYSDTEMAELEAKFREIVGRWGDFSIAKDLRPELTNIEYWFDETNFADLMRLKSCIYAVSESVVQLDFFRLVMADIIRPCSKSERQTLKPYISRKYPKIPAAVGPSFEKSFYEYLAAVREFSQEVGGPTRGIKWIGFDGTKFETVGEAVDVAITSPPYINSIDYVRSIKLESSWIGFADDRTLASVKNIHVGEARRDTAEIPEVVKQIVHPFSDIIQMKDRKRGDLVLTYFADMLSNIKSVYDALAHGGEYHIIVGESVIRGVRVPTHTLLAQLGSVIGFQLVEAWS